MIDKVSLEDKNKFNELFSDYMDLEDQKDHIKEGQKSIKEEISGLLSEDKSIVNKVVSYLVKQRKKGENDELERIYELVEDLES